MFGLNDLILIIAVAVFLFGGKKILDLVKASSKRKDSAGKETLGGSSKKSVKSSKKKSAKSVRAKK